MEIQVELSVSHTHGGLGSRELNPNENSGAEKSRSADRWRGWGIKIKSIHKTQRITGKSGKT